MESQKMSTLAKLFAAVFGIMCLLFTGAVGYLFTLTTTTSSEMMMMILLVVIMWMSYVGIFVDLNK